MVPVFAFLLCLTPFTSSAGSSPFGDNCTRSEPLFSDGGPYLLTDHSTSPKVVALLSLQAWFFILLVVSAASWYMSVPKNLPPGPKGLPFVGSWITYRRGSDQHLLILKHIQKYGPLFRVYIANKLVIILGDYNIIQEALVKQGDVFAGRPQWYSFMPPVCRHHGLALSEGELWKEQRRFTISTLRDFGVGRPICEHGIKEEIDHLKSRLDQLAKTKTAFDPHGLVTCAVSNIISQLIFGRRFTYDDQEFVRQFSSLSRRSTNSGVGFLTPFLLSKTLSWLASFLPVMRQLDKEVDEFACFVQKELDKTKTTFDPDSEPSNYIHAFMTAALNQQGNSFTDHQLTAAVIDLFVAGSETSATTIRWAIILLVHHPEVQEALCKEIRDRVGGLMPDYADRGKLPFTEAVIMEVQRFGNLVPFGVPRRTLEPTKLKGYDIPADAVIIPFLHNVLHNPEVFADPQIFNPYRFLDAEGKVIRDPRLTPFQLGKRACLGESLARMELFLMITGIFSQYRFYFPSDQNKPSLRPLVGLGSTPKPFRVCIDRRAD